MATLAFAIFNYELQTATEDIKLIHGKNKFHCHYILQKIIMDMFSDIFTIETFTDFTPQSDEDFQEWIDFVNSELIDNEMVLIANFV